jgi:hypothetical protein
MASGIVKNATVTQERAALGRDNDLAKGRDSVLSWHGFSLGANK